MEEMFMYRSLIIEFVVHGQQQQQKNKIEIHANNMPASAHLFD